MAGIAFLIGDGADVAADGVFALKSGLGVLLLLLALRQWRGRSKAGDPPAPPPTSGRRRI